VSAFPNCMFIDMTRMAADVSTATNDDATTAAIVTVTTTATAISAHRRARAAMSTGWLTTGMWRDAGDSGYAFSPCDYQMHFKSVGVSREAVLVDEGRRGIVRVVSHPSAWPLRGRCVAPLINGTKQIPLLRSEGLTPLLYSGFSRLMILLQLSCPQ
jgi:hypothetical protein